MKIIDQCDLLILDAVELQDYHPSHLTLPGALTCIRKIKPKRALLLGMTHQVDHDIINSYLAQLRQSEGLDVQLSYDGLCLDVDLWWPLGITCVSLGKVDWGSNSLKTEWNKKDTRLITASSLLQRANHQFDYFPNFSVQRMVNYLVALDGSEGSKAAFLTAIQLYRNSDNLFLATVVSELFWLDLITFQGGRRTQTCWHFRLVTVWTWRISTRTY